MNRTATWALSVALAALVFSITPCQLSAQASLSIALELERQTSEVGQPVALNVSFRNNGDESFYIRYSGVDYGAGSMQVIATRDDCRYSSPSLHLDRDISELRLDYKPVRAHEAFVAPLISVNDPNAMNLPGLVLREPGQYLVSVRFISTGASVEGMLWPIWRGEVHSSPQSLTITAPTVERLEAFQGRLESCAPDDCTDDILGYFAIVRDVAAADRLNQLLDQSSVATPLLLNAVANQRRTADRHALRRYAEREPLSRSIIELMIQRMMSRDSCSP